MQGYSETQRWSYYNPTHIMFGNPGLGQMAGAIQQAAKSKVVIVTGSSSAKDYGYVEQVQHSVGGDSTVLYSGINPEPTQADAQRLRTYLAEERPDAVIALGGGSVIDVAKIACVAADSSVEIADLMDRKVPPPQRHSLLVAIPTTAGSGSELTPFAVLTNMTSGLKQSLPSSNLYPDFAVLVPDFLRTVPRKVASDTGMDALAHAFEALWSIQANPISDGLAYWAIELIHRHFIPYLDAPEDTAHAGAMSTAAAMAGKAFSNTFTAACHALSYPIGARFGLSHGAACAVTLDLVARVNAPAVSRKYNVLSQLLPLKSSELIPDFIASIRDATGCIPKFSELGATHSDIHSIATHVFRPLMANNPVRLSEETITQMLQYD